MHVKKKVAGVLAGLALVGGISVAAPATASARPDPGQGYVKCYTGWMVTSNGGFYPYKVCR